MFFVHLADNDLPYTEYRRLLFRNFCVIDYHRYVPFVISINQSFPRLWFIIDMTYHRNFSMKYKTSATNGAGTAYLPKLTPTPRSVFVAQSCICYMDLSFTRFIWPLYYLPFELRLSIPLSFFHANNKISITNENARGQQSDNQEWTIQRHCQHCAYTKQDENKQYKRKTQHRKLKEWATWTSLNNGSEPTCSWSGSGTTHKQTPIRHEPYIKQPEVKTSRT